MNFMYYTDSIRNSIGFIIGRKTHLVSLCSSATVASPVAKPITMVGIFIIGPHKASD